MLILYSIINHDIHVYKEEGVNGMFYLSGFLNEVRDKLDRNRRTRSTIEGFRASQEFKNFCNNYLLECHLQLKPTENDPERNCYFCSHPLLIEAAKYASASTRIFVQMHGDVVSHDPIEEDESEEEDDAGKFTVGKCEQCEIIESDMKQCNDCERAWCENCETGEIWEACSVCRKEWKDELDRVSDDHINCNCTKPIWLCDACIVRGGGGMGAQ